VLIGESKKRPTFSATYARKPINEIALSRDTFADIATFSGNVILNPVVLNHNVYSVDLNMDSNSFKSTLSFLGDNPENVSAQGLETMQILSPLNIYTAYVAFDLNSVLDRKMEVYAAASLIEGGEIRDLTSDGNVGTVTYATSRTLFKKPIRLGLKGEALNISNRSLTTDISFTYDQQLKGSLLSAAVTYPITRQLGINAGIDLLGVENEATASTENNFLEQNKSNDRISAGVNYVF
jgi:hypothetical protein